MTMRVRPCNAWRARRSAGCGDHRSGRSRSERLSGHLYDRQGDPNGIRSPTMSRKLWVIAAVSAVAGASEPTTTVADGASVAAPTITTWRGPKTADAFPWDVLTCDAGATPYAAFSWQLDGIDIPGATAQTYTPGN